jgi:hypothetical protein
MNTPTDDHATPYIQSFNLSVQHDLSAGLTLEMSYIGNKGTKLFDKQNINEPRIFDNQVLEAFNVTRAGGSHPLFDRMLAGLVIPGVPGRVGENNLSGSEAFRRWASTRTFLANGSVAQFAAFLNSSNQGGQPGNLLRRAGLPENFIMMSPQFSQAQWWGTSRNSTYHSLQTQLTKRVSQGLSGQFTYTWSKALGYASGGDTAATTIDPRNRSRDKGRLGFDHTHAFAAHGTWELPFGAGRTLLSGAGTLLNRIVGGWQISTIYGYTSGDPLTITSSVRTVGSSSNLSLPNIVGAFPKDTGDVKVQSGFVEYFEGLSSRLAPTTGLFGSDPNNLAQFSTNRNIVDAAGNVLLTNPQPGEIGTLGSRWIDGPGQMSFDISLAKRMQITEAASFTFRVDAIDALNTPQWSNPNTDVNNVNFGRITSASGSRKITLSARIDF